MYSNIPQVNILTALLLAHGVRHAVLCPGSRNAPLCHNINECRSSIRCYPVTDERSAGFFAIGVSQANGMAPVVVCVTSGSAILDTAPAVAEAYYQGVPLIVVAADRPASWIGQLDGQTMPQPDALGQMVRKAVSLPEGNSDEDLWFANRLVNEAIVAATSGGRGPVLINVPLHEPLYGFTEAELPEVRKVEVCEPRLSAIDDFLVSRIRQAKRPMMIIGQTNEEVPEEDILRIKLAMPVLSEAISSIGGQAINEAVEVICHSTVIDKSAYEPDLVVYAGGTLVSKSLKAFIRQTKNCETILISPDGELHDVFQNTTLVVRATLADAIRNLSAQLKDEPCQKFAAMWRMLLTDVQDICSEPTDRLTQLGVMQTFAGHIDQVANSMAVRLLCMTQTSHAFCNRGINGIDGSLSTAAGYAAALPLDRFALCAIGDLSFFYDQNALWNRNVDGRLRILLINNGGGGIFSRFAGLKDSAAREDIVMARHWVSAAGICQENGVDYRTAKNLEELETLKEWLSEDLYDNSDAPARLLEVFTNIDEDGNALKEFYANIVTAYDKRMEEN